MRAAAFGEAVEAGGLLASATPSTPPTHASSSRRRHGPTSCRTRPRA